ncbi:MAG: glutamate-5-semialdehyde dehydrogenase [Verrucomicrobia bacterium]|nr:glutamate-5-semialdehyde dehydrogenase [Verrucomicrobiota bacterium]
MDLRQQITALATRSRDASRLLAKLDTAAKNKLLLAMADSIEQSAAKITVANAKDLEAGKKSGLSSAMLDRLTLTDKRIADIAKGVREVAGLPDPVGTNISEWTRPNGIRIQKVRVPIGVILIIYESRPNVTVDAAVLCFKTGNAVILRGGSEAIHSNLALAEAMNVPGLPADAITVVPTTDRAAIDELLKLDELINLCIPRGGEGLIRAVAEKSRIPVIKHYKGVCHVYVDRDADFDMAEKIILNAKCQRPGVCNAIETLLVDAPLAKTFLPRIEKALTGRGVAIRRDADWTTEYLDLIIGLRVVNGVGEAIDHITQYGSAHSDAIVTKNKETAERFLREVDSSSVFWNASTRLADGGQYGFGAEIGISTDKLHARGPMGLEDLTSYKYVVTGTGQLRE